MQAILDKLCYSPDKGNLLEVVLQDTLKDLGYRNVRLQRKGTQYGFDLYAEKTTRTGVEAWKFECKNLKHDVTIEDVAPKLLWHIQTGRIDNFVIVSTTEVSNDLFHLLENHSFPFSVTLWTGDTLAATIAQSPAALDRLGLTGTTFSGIEPSPITFHAKTVTLHVLYKSAPPPSFDYFYLEEELVKAFTEDRFKILVGIENNSDNQLTVTSLSVKTLRYEPVPGRVLRQHKMKGLFTPEKFLFCPPPVMGEEQELLTPDQLYSAPPHGEEALLIELSKNTTPGYYELFFAVKGKLGGRQICLYSSVFPLHVRDKYTDVLQLTTVGGHYDSAASAVLAMTHLQWQKVKKEVGAQKSVVFLGPTFLEVVQRQMPDATWRIKYIKTKKGAQPGTATIKPTTQSSLLIDLGVPVSEPLHDPVEWVSPKMVALPPLWCLCWVEDTLTKQVKVSPAVHLTFQEFEPVDLPFGLSITPSSFQGSPDGSIVLFDTSSKAL